MRFLLIGVLVSLLISHISSCKFTVQHLSVHTDCDGRVDVLVFLNTTCRLPALTDVLPGINTIEATTIKANVPGTTNIGFIHIKRILEPPHRTPNYQNDTSWFRRIFG